MTSKHFFRGGPIAVLAGLLIFVSSDARAEGRAGAKPLQTVNVVNFMGGQPGMLEAVQRAGVAVRTFSVPCRDVGPACRQLAAIAAANDGPIVLTGWSRGGRVAMALAAASKSPESGFLGRIKGQLLFAPEVKTQHSAWKKVFGQSLPDHKTVLAAVARLGGRAGDDVQQIDERAQETNISIATCIFAGKRDNVVSCHYQEKVATEPSNTGVRAFVAAADDHFAVSARTLQLVTEQARQLLQAVAAGTALDPLPADKRVTTY